MKYIILPNGQKTSVSTYAKAWKAISAKPEELYPGFDFFPTRGREILAKIRAGLHDRINSHIPGYGTGRKWDHDWQRATHHAAREVNAPRLIVRYLPPHLRARLAHRLA